MSGHSKWANIKHKKEASDKKKGKIFSKLAKEIMVCVKQSGKDPNSNPRLRMALIEARSANMPRENIDRAIKKGAGELGNVVYEEIVYEGYGPQGTAIIVECLTDNKNRTIGDVRLTFDRNNGNLAASGAVGWMFQRKAHFVITDEANANEEKLMEWKTAWLKSGLLRRLSPILQRPWRMPELKRPSPVLCVARIIPSA